MDKEELYNTILNNLIHKYSLLNEIYAIRDTRVEKQDYTIGVNGFVSLDVLLENYNQVNIIEDLQHQLEEKQKVIDEAIKFIRNGRDGKGQFYKCCERKVSIKEDEELLEILERGKNANITN